MHVVSDYCDIGVAEVLLNHGSAVDEKDHDGYTPLELSLSYLPMVKLLLEKGADIQGLNRVGLPYLWSAIRKGPAQVLEFLLKQTKYDLNILNHSGESPVHVAVATRDEEIIRIILDAGFPVNSQDSAGQTPLHCAIISNCFQSTVQLLLDHGADPSAVGEGGKTLLHFIIDSGRVDILKMVLNLNIIHVDRENQNKYITYTQLNRDSGGYSLNRHLSEKKRIEIREVEKRIMKDMLLKYWAKSTPAAATATEQGPEIVIAAEEFNW